MKSLVLVLALFLSSASTACQFDSTDEKLFIASNVAIFADWQTTRDIARRPTEFQEIGPIPRALIGAHPSMAGVNYYFLGRFLTNYYIACNLDGNFRSIYLTTTTVAHGTAAVRNYGLGLRIKF